MSEPTVKLLYRDGQFFLPEEYRGHPDDRLTSTPGDNLAEFAGRIAYDSLCGRKGRPTPEYHAHVRETKHHSVYAHVVETFEVGRDGLRADKFFDDATAIPYGYMCAVQCRPGVWVTEVSRYGFRFSASLRAVIEWAEQGAVLFGASPSAVNVQRMTAEEVHGAVLDAVRSRYPMALAGVTSPRAGPSPFVRNVAPKHAQEQWASLYLAGVSRDLLQELVRHHYQTNFSVRSTRYVDESESTSITHPAFDVVVATAAKETADQARAVYRRIYGYLTASGVDTKTARGAARSVLPGATETRLVFSLSKFQARHLLSLRANESTGAVDPEILRLAKRMREVLLTVWPDL